MNSPTDATRQAASSRADFLHVLRFVQGKGPVTLHLYDATKQRKAACVRAVLPDSSAFLVTALETPLGVMPTAILRGNDIITMSIGVHLAPIENESATGI